ncbi:MAG: PepSY-associated TM helix domain-containing protein [Candidatus Methylopumilus sp.]|jgi:hypothetical protein
MKTTNDTLRLSQSVAKENGQIISSRKGEKRKRSTRSTLLLWLRKIHLYLGLWGAVLGLLFGVTGILLNHRVVMKIPLEKAVQHTVDLQLPDRSFQSPDELSKWLERYLNLTMPQPPFIKVEPERHVIWADKEVVQPERWIISYHRPDKAVTAEHYPGSRLVRLELADSTLVGTLTRLHMSVGVNAIWILLADSIAGSFILLSLSDLLLWTQFHTMRIVAMAVSVGALVAAICIAVAM